MFVQWLLLRPDNLIGAAQYAQSSNCCKRSVVSSISGAGPPDRLLGPVWEDMVAGWSNVGGCGRIGDAQVVDVSTLACCFGKKAGADASQ